MQKQGARILGNTKSSIEIINNENNCGTWQVALEAVQAIEYHQSSLRKNGGKNLWEFIKELGFYEIKIISHLIAFRVPNACRFAKKRLHRL